MNDLLRQLFALSELIRYVAVYRDGQLSLNERPGLQNASSSESDKYEELIVNPTLLKLVSQRGNIDCGGLEYVIIRYGHFFQLVHSISGGHVSIGLEPSAASIELVPNIRGVLGHGSSV